MYSQETTAHTNYNYTVYTVCWILVDIKIIIIN